MELYERAAHALSRAEQADHDFGVIAPPVGLALARARWITTLSAMLGVDPALVTVADDPGRVEVMPLAQVLTVAVHDAHPDDQRHRHDQRHRDDQGDEAEDAVLRFIPVLGFDGVFAVLGCCQDCGAPEVPVAVVTRLADLGAYLRDGRAPDNGWRHTLGWDPIHRRDCPWTTPSRP
ncbi:MAG: hypothetical protein M3Z25_17465 [Actinomycetota bacterium]|nr:hypothetical protein [Actinomycetota bacterium]